MGNSLAIWACIRAEAENIITPEDFVGDGDIIEFGNSKLQVLYTPGMPKGVLPGKPC